MRTHGVDALLIPSADPHQSEYLPGRWRGTEWASGFTGSVGQLIVAGEHAALVVDGRYVLQARDEVLGHGVEVVQVDSPRAADGAVLSWLVSRLPDGAVVAVDGQVCSFASAQQLAVGLSNAGKKLLWQHDLLAAAWPDRPELPTTGLREHRMPEAGSTRPEKLAALRRRLAELEVDGHWTAALDEIAWLLNLRGDDVPFNPVFLAHLVVGPASCKLFVGRGRVDAALRHRLEGDGVELHDYEAIGPMLGSLAAGVRLLLDPARVSVGLHEGVGAEATPIHGMNPLQSMKSPRNPQQARYLRDTMDQDGAALCEFYAGLMPELAAGTLVESDLHARVTGCRARRPGFQGPSFNTIAGFGPNAAMPHYSATPHRASALAGRGLLLIDSGGHYLGGTTDITRVWPVGGAPDELQRRDYTLVMKGLIALSRARFPRGTLAPMLDALARVPLWAEGLDYGHGTGHGVGHYLNVHEGPQWFSQAMPRPEAALQPGMVISIEPGLYRPGQWGIRLENLVMCVPAGATAFGDFLAFETLSQCPFDTRCLEVSLLSPEERAWIDDYHATVRRRLSPLLSGAALDWLHSHTQALKS